ncbi:RNA 2',3'-cyclic phosphodiesterase [Halocatena halophila]|uniref:RNA 2',3'-cyclic phosphodiesterase n=1 Tax=Halocatena halophila TaxID=2814576 RepID=UPI002ED25CD2
MRLFISIDIEPTPELKAIQAPFAELEGVRLVPSEQVHVTLQFLDEQPAERLSAITDAIDAAIESVRVEPFTLSLAGYGVFPDREYITVIWAAIEQGTTQLNRLNEAIEFEMSALGIEPEDRAFVPHATIARMDHAASKTTVQSLIETTTETHTQRVTAVELLESTRTGDGPKYDRRYARRLKSATAG